ncbi:MAG: hypothetical protein MJ252_17805 [archaeon]|nr:hypothetical protein [archaeon]
MFMQISDDDPNQFIPYDTRVCGKPMNSQESNFSFGRPEWQQNWTTVNKIFHNEKNIKESKIILDKPYLKANYSTLQFNHDPSKDPFLTSNKRDFKEIHMRPEDRSVLDSKTKNLIRNSKIILGDCPPTLHSVYQYKMKDPKDQIPKYDYSKIHFKYDPYNLHPITQEPIFKDPQCCWGFDYWNKDKNKKYVSNRNTSFINTDYKKVYDPITNRFFKDTVKNFEYSKKVGPVEYIK